MYTEVGQLKNTDYIFYKLIPKILKMPKRTQGTTKWFTQMSRLLALYGEMIEQLVITEGII